MAASSETLRARLVRELEKAGDIRTEAVRDAFLRVPRELFVPEVAKEQGLDAVYRNDALPTKKDARGLAVSSSSQPSIMATMLEELRLEPGMTVLEIGAGTGYNAALMKTIVGASGRVVTVDIEADLVRKARAALRRGGYPARVVLADGRLGWRKAAPYDRIIVTASAPEVPKAWMRQLKDGGLLELPLRIAENVFWPQAVVTFQRQGDRLGSISVVRGGFMGLRERTEDPAPGFTASIYAGYVAGERGTSFGSIWGWNLETLPEKAKRSLAAAVAMKPAVIPLDMRIPRGDFDVFLGLWMNHKNLVSLQRPKASQIGVIASDGSSLGSLRGGTSFYTGLEVSGTREASNLIQQAIADWERLARPRLSSLHVEAIYGGRSRGGVRSFRRGSSVLSFRWES